MSLGLSGVHRSRAAHRGCPPTPRLLTFSVFPAQFSVEVLNDPRQLLLFRLVRHFVRDGDVEVVRLVLCLYRLHMVPELHDIVAAATTAAAGSLPPEPSYELPGELEPEQEQEPVHRATRRQLIGRRGEACFGIDNPSPNHRARVSSRPRTCREMFTCTSAMSETERINEMRSMTKDLCFFCFFFESVNFKRFYKNDRPL